MINIKGSKTAMLTLGVLLASAGSAQATPAACRDVLSISTASMKSSVLKAEAFLKEKFSHLSAEENAKVLSFLERSILADPLFQQNPTAYMRNWKREMGGFDIFMFPSDAVRMFLRNLQEKGLLETYAAEVKANGITSSHPEEFVSNQQIKTAQDQVLNVVREYVKTKWANLDMGKGDGYQKSIVSFLETQVLPDPSFQNQPSDYMAQWMKGRGGFDMLAVPYDPALRFLQELHSQGRLGAFATSVKDARFTIEKGAPLYSDKWTVKPKTSRTISVTVPLMMKLDPTTLGRLSQYQDGETLTFRIGTRDLEDSKVHAEVLKIAQGLQKAGLPMEQIDVMITDTAPLHVSIKVKINSDLQRDQFLKELEHNDSMASANVVQ